MTSRTGACWRSTSPATSQPEKGAVETTEIANRDMRIDDVLYFPGTGERRPDHRYWAVDTAPYPVSLGLTEIWVTPVDAERNPVGNSRPWNLFPQEKTQVLVPRPGSGQGTGERPWAES